jgi:outer membrane protein assembly factor BamB
MKTAGKSRDAGKRWSQVGRSGRAGCNAGPERRGTDRRHILIALLFAAGVATAIPARAQGPFNTPGNILIADQYNNRIVEVNPNTHAIVWSFGDGSSTPGPNSVVAPNDAQRVGELTIIAGSGAPAGTPTAFEPNCQNGCPDNRVIVVDRNGKIVWHYGVAGVAGSGDDQLSTPVQATFLPTKHILITDQGNQRVIEVNQFHRIRWQYGTTGLSGSGPNQLNNPNSAELLENGNILIADESNNRVIEVNRDRQIVWQYGEPNDTTIINGAGFASRLPNGHTLITDSNNSRVSEVDAAGKVVFTYSTDARPGSASPSLPTHAIRLFNGNTLISDQANNQVIEIDSEGHIVFSQGQLGVLGRGFDQLNWPYDAKVIGEYVGITPPFGAFSRQIDHSPFPF